MYIFWMRNTSSDEGWSHCVTCMGLPTVNNCKCTCKQSVIGPTTTGAGTGGNGNGEREGEDSLTATIRRRYGMSPRLSAGTLSPAFGLSGGQTRTIQKAASVEHRQREAKDALELLLQRVYRRPALVRHLLVYLLRALIVNWVKRETRKGYWKSKRATHVVLAKRKYGDEVSSKWVEKNQIGPVCNTDREARVRTHAVSRF